jgi:hypothetical protein
MSLPNSQPEFFVYQFFFSTYPAGKEGVALYLELPYVRAGMIIFGLHVPICNTFSQSLLRKSCLYEPVNGFSLYLV